MLKHSRWMLLAMAAVLLSTADADAFGRRRRGCNGCNGSYSSCHGCSGGRVIYGGCHSSCHGCSGGRVIYNGCQGGAVYGGCHGGVSGGQPMVYSQGQIVPRDASYEQGERLPQPRRDDFNENGSETGQIFFRAPRGAQIWVDGQLVERRGDNWVWTSPNLTGRRNYEVRARWNDDGRVINRTRTVNIQSGGRTTLDFNRAEGSEIVPAAGESDRGNQAPRSNSTPNTPPRPRDAEPQPQPRPGTNDLQPRNPTTPRDNGTLPKAQPRPEDR